MILQYCAQQTDDLHKEIETALNRNEVYSSFLFLITVTIVLFSIK